MRLDTLRHEQTPEGILLPLHLAGPLARGVAWFLDTLIRITCYIVLANGAFFFGSMGITLLILLYFLMEWLYPVIFEVFASGATPGKKIVGLKVMHLDGTPVGWRASLLRNLLWPVDFLPGFYMMGLFCSLLSPHFQRIGDIAAGTIVVYRFRSPRKTAPPTLPAGEITAPAYALHPEEQQTILDFAYRSQRISEDRGAELAELSGPLVKPQTGPAAREKLLAIGRYLAGKDS